MKDTRYAFCVAKIRALENRLLTKKDIELLIEQQDSASAFNFLVKRDYAIEGESVDELIKRHGKALEMLLYENAPDKKELNALYILNDYFNIKVLVKCSVEGIDPTDYLIYPTTIDFKALTKNRFVGDFPSFNESYKDVAEKAYDIALKSSNGKFSDALIDKAAIDALCAYAKRKNKDIYGRVCGFLADSANIKTVIRCVLTSQNADYIDASVGDCFKLNRDELIASANSGFDKLVTYLEGTVYKDSLKIYTDNPSAFEKWCDDQIIEITSVSVYTSFGFGPIVHYFYRKTLEIKTVRMILAAIKSNVDKDKIRERIRELYA